MREQAYVVRVAGFRLDCRENPCMAIRDALAALDAGNLVTSDAARTAALLALRMGDLADRADAEPRLVAPGDQLYLQKLGEDW